MERLRWQDLEGITSLGRMAGTRSSMKGVALRATDVPTARQRREFQPGSKGISPGTQNQPKETQNITRRSSDFL